MTTSNSYYTDMKNGILLTTMLQSAFKRLHIKASVRLRDDNMVTCAAKRKTLVASPTDGQVFVDGYIYKDAEDAAHHIIAAIKEN